MKLLHDNRVHSLLSTTSEQSMTSSSSSYKAFYDSFVSRSNFHEKFNEVVETMSRDKDALKLDRVRTCLAIGPGDGLNEIYVMKRLMPNLESFTAVEPDPASAAELRLNLQLQLPTVTSEVHEMKAEDYFGTGDNRKRSYDVVLFFSSLYYVSEGDRQVMFKTLFDTALNSGGKVMLNHAYRSNLSNDYFALVEVLIPDYAQPEGHLLRKEILRTGFRLCGEYHYSYETDMSDPDEGLLTFFTVGMGVAADRFSMDTFKAGIRQVCSNHLLPYSTFKK